MPMFTTLSHVTECRGSGKSYEPWTMVPVSRACPGMLRCQAELQGAKSARKQHQSPISGWTLGKLELHTSNAPWSQAERMGKRDSDIPRADVLLEASSCFSHDGNFIFMSQ